MTNSSLALKTYPQDFVVTEDLDIELDGQGEHLWLWVEKVGLDTAWAAKCLAKAYGIGPARVSWSGRKDRHAVCRQWFSLHLGLAESLPGPLPEGLTILGATRHGRKLRVGTHKGNYFQILLRGQSEDLSARWQTLVQQGVPNWFGEQRFSANNYQQAMAWMAGQYQPKKHERDMLLSSVRSQVFNELLAQRVADGSWQQLRLGELCLLGDGQSCFVNLAQQAEENAQRCARGEIQPSLPLIGRQGKTLPQDQALMFEHQGLEPFAPQQQWLSQLGLQQARRACRFWPTQASMVQQEQSVELSFRLTKGCYATALLKELCHYELQSTEYPTE